MSVALQWIQSHNALLSQEKADRLAIYWQHSQWLSLTQWRAETGAMAPRIHRDGIYQVMHPNKFSNDRHRWWGRGGMGASDQGVSNELAPGILMYLHIIALALYNEATSLVKYEFGKLAQSPLSSCRWENRMRNMWTGRTYELGEHVNSENMWIGEHVNWKNLWIGRTCGLENRLRYMWIGTTCELLQNVDLDNMWIGKQTVEHVLHGCPDYIEQRKK